MASKTSNKRNTRKRTTPKKSAAGRSTKSKAAAKNQDNSFMAAEILIWITLAVSILLVISNFGLAGYIGNKIADFMQGLFGWMAYVFPALLFCGVSFLVSNKGNRVAYIKVAAGTVLMIQCCVLFELINDRGGSIGTVITDIMAPAVGIAGTYVIVIILMMICIVLITERSILGGVKKGSAKVYDTAKVDAQRHRDEKIEKKARREQMRLDHQVSGVSFNTTLEKKEEEPQAEPAIEKNTQSKKATNRT